MSSNRVIIFCQAPAYVPFVLSLYEEKQKTNPVSIFVINVEGIFTFLKGLKLNVEQLVFIPYSQIRLSKVTDVYKERKRLNALYRKYFSDIKKAEVYFYSRFEDWFTAAFIYRLSKINEIKITYLNHNDDSVNFDVKKHVSLRLRMLLFSLKYLTGADFLANTPDRLPEFPVDKYAIAKGEAILNKNVFTKYVYNDYLLDKQKANAMFFLSPCDTTMYDPRYYDDKLAVIIDIFKQYDYNIIVKGHPRTGIPNIVKEIADVEIPSYVPAEFIDVKSLAICMGLETTAICYFAKHTSLPTYSVIRMGPSVSDYWINVFVDYLKNQSDNKMQFINNESQLIEVVKAHSKKYDER